MRRPGPAPRNVNGWQALAIAALIAATAGWTTVAVLALRSPSVAVVASPTETIDPDATEDPSSAPLADTHDAPELEALLPTELSGTPLQRQSWDGGGILTDDAWSTSLTTFLTGAGKKSTDLRAAQADDPEQVLEVSVGAYRVPGLKAEAVRDALIAAWKGDNPAMKLTELTLGGKKVTRGDFGEDVPSTYLYLRDDVVFDIWTSDEKVALEAIASLPVPGASASSRPSVAPGASLGPASPAP